MTLNELNTLVTGLWAKVKSYISTVVSSMVTKSELASYNPIIEDTRSSAVAAITGVAPFSELVDGQRIVLHSKFYYTGAVVFTLNLTLSSGATTGAKNIKYITTYNSWNNCANTGIVGKIQNGVYYQLHFDIAKDAWLMEQDSIQNLTTMTQAEINAGNSTQTRTISPKMLRDNFYVKSEVDGLIPDVSGYVDGGKYDSDAKKILLTHGESTIAEIDATTFIKDGMIDTVTVTNGNLVISFNTDAGKQPISLPISRVFDANNYYTKTEIDNKGYLTSETDPVFSSSVVASIKSTDIANWNAKQSAIADLDDIRTGASLGATALQSYTETDPTVPSWAKQPNKPTYTASEVGALPSTTQIPSKTSDLTNDSGFVTGSKIYYGTCTTAAATDPKVCTVEEFPLDGNGKPLVGTQICVKFSATDTSTTTTPHLNVNNTGAKRIWVNTAVLSSAKSAYHGYADRYITYMWDGTYWVWRTSGYDANTTYTNVALGHGYATQNNSAAAKAVTASLANYTLTDHGTVSIHFNYDVPAGATLNVNNKGAKAIYHRNAAIADGVIKAGDTATFIYHTYYHLISIDRDEAGGDMSGYYTKSEIDTKIGNVETLLASI